MGILLRLLVQATFRKWLYEYNTIHNPEFWKSQGITPPILVDLGHYDILLRKTIYLLHEDFTLEVYEKRWLWSK